MDDIPEVDLNSYKAGREMFDNGASLLTVRSSMIPLDDASGFSLVVGFFDGILDALRVKR